MTWCIESCNFDVDVDLLFQENLTIGQKIALTEKIVVMLPKMNCPHRIEPHQIQGLDCIHIFPVIQWLVKRSMEMREERASYLRSFAIEQFNKHHKFSDDHPELPVDDIIPNVQMVKRAYDPRRRFKRRDAAPKDDIAKIRSTLLEYGSMAIPATSSSIVDSDNTTQESEEMVTTKEFKDSRNESREVQFEEDRLSASAVGNIVGMQAQEIVQVAEKYASMSISEREDNENEIGYSRARAALEKQRSILQNRMSKIVEDRDALTEKLADAIEQSEKTRTKRKSIEDAFLAMENMETDDKKETIKTLEELLVVHTGLKEQEHKFREQCKNELSNLQRMVQEIETGEPHEEQSRVAEYDEVKAAINRTRLLLAKKNRAIASLTRQLDDVPGRSELTQYQRRFMELYNQVSAKHKETKQYYTLYNTLDDTKLYLSKELSLLNSIQDNYNEAMASTSGKEQFLKQFEAIIAGVKRNKEKVERRCADEKDRRYALNRQLVSLMEQQRKYVAAVRQLTIECRKNEALLAQLRAP
ncbi:coiled-coil domain-containing protein 93 isoform X2 [Venturia canescens]|nr:coiled-coil domain-containing protein 93 isoform X2 [Venturia canescens]